MLLLSYVGGIAAGLLVSWLGMLVLRRVSAVILENMLTLLVPFVAFLAAEAIGASGVLAVVVAGLVVSQVAPKLDRAETRQQVRSFWSFATFLLNGPCSCSSGSRPRSPSAGPRGPRAAGRPRHDRVGVGSRSSCSASRSSTCRGARSDSSPCAPVGVPREGHRDRVVSGFTGFRGAVSLAAAVAVPRMVEGGGAFPDRDLIVFVVAGWSS